MPGSTNVVFELGEWAAVAPDAPALLLREAIVPYGNLGAAVNACALALSDAGLKPGDICGLVFIDEVLLAVTLLAVLRLGATVLSLPHSATGRQHRELLARTGARAVASDRPLKPGTAQVTLEVSAELLMRPDAAQAPFVREPHGPAVLISGSGSTGEPKLIPLTHAQLRGRIELKTGWRPLRAADRVAAMSHLDFFGTKLRMLEALRAGAAFARWNATSPETPGLCALQGITVLHTTVYHTEMMIRSLPAGTTRALAGLDAMFVASSTLTDDLRARARDALTGNLYVRYGTNESGQITTAGPPEIFNLAGTVGCVDAGAQIRIVDDHGEPVPVGTVGSLRIRSPGLCDGYWGDKDATAKAFKDGWFTPNDLGKFNAAGHLIFYGRADDMMIMNGINIYPAEIERAFAAHPDVLDVAALPASDPLHQQVPVCAVELAPGSTATPRSLFDFGARRLGAHKPQHVYVLDKIPRTEQGKVKRTQLAQEILKQAAQRKPPP
ncbi:class I adenylate-forming enzyme family protein [Caenimonas koreensis]|uniref:class I adenylate-forming enzyme family protein n=1 Tax=Caenimonas koreensis TaxID=367474 RepID=UPI0037840005